MARQKQSVKLTPIPINVVTAGGLTGVEISWAYPTPPLGLTGFDVRRDDVVIATVSTTSYIDTGAAPGETYDYTIVANRTNAVNGRTYKSLPSDPVAGSWSTAAASDIEILSITNSTAGPTIAWNAVTGATTYQVWRSVKPYGDANYSPVQSTGGTSWQDTTGTAGAFYFYRVSYDGGGLSTPRLGSKYGTSAGDPVVLGTLQLTRTFDSIGIYLPYTGDADLSANARAEFRKVTVDDSSPWRQALRLDQRAGGTNKFILGSILALEAGTEYEVQITVTDPGGGGGTVNTTKQTRDELAAIDAYADRDLTVAPSGGTHTTLQTAIVAANADASGPTIGIPCASTVYLQRPTQSITRAGVTIVAQTSAIGAPEAVDNGTDYAPPTTGPKVVVYERFTAPTLSPTAEDAIDTSVGRLGKGVWARDLLVTNTPWKTAAGSSDVQQMAYSPVVGGDYTGAKEDAPIRCPRWKAAGALLTDASSWGSLLYTNLSQNDGFWQNSASSDVYVRLPGDIDPNTCYVWMGSGAGASNTSTAGMRIDADDVTISGLEFRAIGCAVRWWHTADRPLVDHCQFHNVEIGIHVRGASAGVTTIDGVAQYCRASDTRIWSDDPVLNRGVAWKFIKTYIRLSDGSEYPSNRIGERAENHLLRMTGGGQQITIRNCTANGGFNGISSTGSNADWTMQRDVDIKDCLFERLGDNAVEPEGVASNWRCWNWVSHDVRSLISTDASVGPYYFWDGLNWNDGSHGVTDDGTGDTDGEGTFLKTGAGPDRLPQPRLYFINVTSLNMISPTKAWTDAITGSGVTGFLNERFFTRNSVFRDVRQLSDMTVAITEWDDDAGFYAAEDDGWQFKTGGATVMFSSTSPTGAQSAEAFITALGGDPATNTTNKLGSTRYTFIDGGTNNGVQAIDAQYEDLATFDLRLATGSAFRNSGVMVENVRDLPGVNFTGALPHRGGQGVV
jgi:hypothetical protein